MGILITLGTVVFVAGLSIGYAIGRESVKIRREIYELTELSAVTEHEHPFITSNN